MSGSVDKSRSLEQLLAAIADIALAAAILDPDPEKDRTDVSQRLWNAARYMLFERHGRQPQAHELVRQISSLSGRRLGWRDVLKLACKSKRVG
jgi:hypothetical protein